MDKKKLIYFALVTLFMLPSCSQVEPAGSELREDGNMIYFRSYLPTVSRTRAVETNTGNFNSCQVTCYNPDDKTLIDPVTREISTYFHDICFVKDENDLFVSQSEDDCRWPDSRSRLHFFAYYPSAESMKEFTDDDEAFSFINHSRLADDTPVFDFQLKNFHVAREIADQKDFVTAYASGTLFDSNNTGISLNFKHQLARIEISAWSGGDKYDFEIAGVRLGNPMAVGDFNFSAITGNPDQSLWANEAQAIVEHIYSAGEKIVRIGRSAVDHKSIDKATSIMGTSGPAMVIPMPARIEAWEGKNDPNISLADYSTDKLYFSVLLRVKNKDGEVVYPYPNDRDNMTVIYFAVDNTGTITKILKKTGDIYYSADDNTPYVPEATEQICGYGWASLPVAAKWEAGKIYSYKLNYSEGIGWHDPDDPNPGEPIIERGKVPFEVNVEEWVPANDEEYTPDLTVPKR